MEAIAGWAVMSSDMTAGNSLRASNIRNCPCPKSLLMSGGSLLSLLIWSLIFCGRGTNGGTIRHLAP